MFRVTLSGKIARDYVQKAKQDPKRTTGYMRVYKWDNKCGELWNGNWKCEARRFKADQTLDGNSIMLEETYNVPTNVPPFDIDDLWDEEYIQVGNVRCGNVLVWTGKKEEIRKQCNEICPLFLNWLTQHTPTHTFKDTDIPADIVPSVPLPLPLPLPLKPNPTSKICFIEEY